MNAMPLVIAALAIFALAYRFYFSFISAKVLMIDKNRMMPSQRMYDGKIIYRQTNGYYSDRISLP